MIDALCRTRPRRVHSARPPSSTRLVKRLRTLAVMSCLGPLVAYAVVGVLQYDDTVQDAWNRVDRASRVAQEHAQKVFETNQMVLLRMLDLLADRSDAELLADGAALHTQLRRMAQGLPQVQGLFVIGADGRALGTDRQATPPRDIDYTDRAWYRSHSTGPSMSPFVTERLTSRATGEPFFDTSLRRSGADGRFLGTVHVSLRPSYFTDFYRELAATDPAIRLAIVRSDLSILARWPDLPVPASVSTPPDHPIARALANGDAGHIEAASPIDGVQRLRSFRRVEGYPLYTLASIDRSWVVQQWLRRMGVLGLFVLPMTLAFVLMTRAAIRRAARLLDAAAELEAATQRRQQAELALMNAQKLETLGRLTGGVAHDFNNLLAIVASNMYLLRTRHVQLANNPLADAIDRAVATGTRLTRQLLAFSRSQALRPQLVDLPSHLASVADMLRPLLGSRIALALHTAPGVGRVRVDPAEFELALVNLAVNARDAMPRGGRLEIRAFMQPQDGREWVCIDVIDTGAGIDPQALPRVFEPFVTTKPAGRGTGLGLSQVRTLCDSAGGDVQVVQTSSTGTTVRMRLPAADAPADDLPLPAPPLPGPGLEILLVEDNEDVAASTTQLLAGMGHRVRRAASADEAELHLATGPRPGLVITDIELAGERDGIALAAGLAQSHPGLPVLLLTGYARRLGEAQSRQLTVLPKPVSAQTLARTIAALVTPRAAAASD
jgi:signal transduction histidine kinase